MSEFLEQAVKELENATREMQPGGSPPKVIGYLFRAVNSLTAAVQLLERRNDGDSA